MERSGLRQSTAGRLGTVPGAPRKKIWKKKRILASPDYKSNWSNHLFDIMKMYENNPKTPQKWNDLQLAWIILVSYIWKLQNWDEYYQLFKFSQYTTFLPRAAHNGHEAAGSAAGISSEWSILSILGSTTVPTLVPARITSMPRVWRIVFLVTRAMRTTSCYEPATHFVQFWHWLLWCSRCQFCTSDSSHGHICTYRCQKCTNRSASQY